jgi:hypothetical protein
MKSETASVRKRENLKKPDMQNLSLGGGRRK